MSDTAAWAVRLEANRAPGLDRRRFGVETLWRALEPALGDAWSVEDIGRSVLGKPIRALRFGRGPAEVLLWSQMHGDESTATMALADLVHLFAAAPADPTVARIASATRVTLVPMLNPDGAEAFQRENAWGIDLNRDARRLLAPESRSLLELHHRIRPAVGFNLHDQEVRRTAGPGGAQVALAFLAPAGDTAGSYEGARGRARLLASLLATRGAAPLLPGRVARWEDDVYDPRAFGDTSQSTGTATVLVECGGLSNDPEKQRLRTVTAATLLMGLEAIAAGAVENADPEAYAALPLNTRVDHDVHLIGAQVHGLADGPLTADVALLYDDPVAATGLRLAACGDLGGATALVVRDLGGKDVRLAGPAGEPLRPPVGPGAAISVVEPVG